MRRGRAALELRQLPDAKLFTWARSSTPVSPEDDNDEARLRTKAESLELFFAVHLAYQADQISAAYRRCDATSPV